MFSVKRRAIDDEGKPNKITAHSVGWSPQFRFAVSVSWSGLCEFVGCNTGSNVKTFQQELRVVPFSFCLGALLVSCSPPAKNDGRESGYYGDFNRVSNALVSIPGIVVTSFWMNRDITLEEFGFDVTTATGQPVHIAIGERDPPRRLARAELVEALKKEIERQ